GYRWGDDHGRPVGYLAHPAVLPVGDEHVAGGVDRHGHGAIEHGGGGRAAVAAEAGGAVARDGDDGAGGLDHLAHPVVVSRVGDEQVAGVVDRHAVGVPERGRGGRAAVAQAAQETAGDGNDDPGRLDDLADQDLVGDEQVAGGVDRHAAGL